MRIILLIPLISLISLGSCKPKQRDLPAPNHGNTALPAGIKAEHDHILEQVQNLTIGTDSSGIIARKLYELMKHHFNEEEDYALPPLGLLPSLVKGEIPEHYEDVIQLTVKLRSQLMHMNVEHQMIAAHLEELKPLIPIDKREVFLELEKSIHNHAKIEEEVLYPASILVGEYIKLKHQSLNPATN